MMLKYQKENVVEIHTGKLLVFQETLSLGSNTLTLIHFFIIFQETLLFGRHSHSGFQSIWNSHGFPIFPVTAPSFGADRSYVWWWNIDTSMSWLNCVFLHRNDSPWGVIIMYSDVLFFSTALLILVSRKCLWIWYQKPLI